MQEKIEFCSRTPILNSHALPSLHRAQPEAAQREMEVDSADAEKVGVLGFPYWMVTRRKLEPHDPFFTAGNLERELLAKQIALDLTEDEKHQLQSMEDVDGQLVFCPIVGCGAHLKSLNDFEDHHHARHTACCSVCARAFPTSRLLSIHISEAHDSFFQAKVARGFPMYECLVDGCGLKLKSYQSRQQHLVDKHKFPASFEFLKKAHPSKKHRQKFHYKQAAHEKGDSQDMSMDVEGKTSGRPHLKHQAKQACHEKETKAEMEIEEKLDHLVSAVSKLTTSDSAPSPISFGRRHARGFQFLPRSVQRNKKPVSTDGKEDTEMHPSL